MKIPDGSWQVEEIAVGGELVAPLPTMLPLTLLVDEGRVSGSSGINTFTGPVGDGPGIGLLATTRMAGPDDLMAQEAKLLEYLTSFDDIEIVETGINLIKEGVVMVSLSSANSG